jgi:hypothetical protein
VTAATVAVAVAAAMVVAAAVRPRAAQRRAPSTPSRRGAAATLAGGASRAAASTRPVALATLGATARPTRNRSCVQPAVRRRGPPGVLAMAARIRAGEFMPSGAAQAVLHGSTLPSRLRSACGRPSLAGPGGSRCRPATSQAGDFPQIGVARHANQAYPGLARVGRVILVRALFRVCVVRWERRCHGLSG